MEKAGEAWGVELLTLGGATVQMSSTTKLFGFRVDFSRC